MNRIALQLIFMTFAIQLPAQTPAPSSTPQPHKVVFVCEHGSVKSLVAASYFNRSAEKRGLLFRAVARGTAPEPSVPLSVQEGLRPIGVDVSTYVPQLFRASDVEGASLIVSFDQNIEGVIAGRARHLRWDNLPAVLANYPRGRDAIVRQVDSLIDALAEGRTP